MLRGGGNLVKKSAPKAQSSTLYKYECVIRSDVVLAEVGRGGDGGVDSARNAIRLVHEGITCTFVFEVIKPLRSGYLPPPRVQTHFFIVYHNENSVKF